MDEERQDEKAKNSLLKDMAKKGISKTIKGLPLKVKLIIAGIILLVFLFIILFVTILTPLMMLLLFDDDGGETAVNDSNLSYVEVNSDVNYWWPVGGNSIEMKDNIEYATGTTTFVRISSYFGSEEDFRNGSAHGAIDIPSNGKIGEVPVIASNFGRVMYVRSYCKDNGYIGNTTGVCGGFGNYIKIKNVDGMITFYAHLSQNSVRVSVGDSVNRGQVIAYIGNSGNTSGAHLHFEMRDLNYKKVDPLGYVDPNNLRPVS